MKTSSSHESLSTSPKQDPKKIIWAIDPFDIIPELHQKIIQLLETLSEQTEIIVEPVFVANDADEIDGTDPKKVLMEILADIPLRELTSPKVLRQRSVSLVSTTEILSQYALERGATSIVVSSHGKSKLDRMLLGSFAETLILHSKVDVLVTSPNTRIQPLRRILFPTDFNRHSKDLFRKGVALAKSLAAEIILFHSVPHEIEPLVQSGVNLLSGTVWTPLDYYVGKAIDHQTRRAILWGKWAQNRGVAARHVIHSTAEPIADSILKLANRTRASVIMMEKCSGPIATALIGSITRQVTRRALCPVWVVRP